MSSQDLEEEPSLDVGVDSPAIMRVVSRGQLQRDEIAVPEPGAQEWQMVDENCLSPCGSSPRSLSHADLEPRFESMGDTDISDPGVDDGFAFKAMNDIDDRGITQAPEPDMRFQGTEITVHQQNTGESASEENAEGIQVMDMAGRDASVQIDKMGSAEHLDADATEVPLIWTWTPSNASTLTASVEHLESQDALPSDESHYSASRGTEEVTPDESDGEDNGDRAPEIEPWVYSEEQSLPDYGVCSVVTGYPMSAHFQRTDSNSSEPMSFDVAERSPSLRRNSSGSRSSADPRAESESHWSQWTKRAGSSKAGKVLERLWTTLQMSASRMGAMIPPKLKARIQESLQYIEVPGSDSTKCRLLVSGLVAVSLALAWTLSKNRSLVRALQRRDAELQTHIVRILDLNAKLTNAVDIPIIRRCGHKSSLSLSQTVF